LVEFQRMSGNNLLFGRFFAACTKFLNSVFGEIESFEATSSILPYERCCLRTESLINYFDADVRVDSMLWMLSAQSMENRREGLSSLAVMSYIPENIAVMCEKDALRDTILNLLEDDCWEADMQEVRLLSTILANLSTATEFLQQFCTLEEMDNFVVRCDEIVRDRTDKAGEAENLFSLHISEILRQLTKLKSNCSM